MTWLLRTHLSDKYEFIITFANTGLEHEKTLEFVRNCDEVFGFGTVWLEAQVHHGERKRSTHKVVDFSSASRRGEPFEEYIKKYGVPNVAFPSCTRELKVAPIESYLKSLGIAPDKVPTAIGIRGDETRRVSPDAGKKNIIYPLVDRFPVDKQDVLDWWGQQPFDLGIEEFEGNCLGCYKKSLSKHFMQIRKDSSVYDFHRRMEKLYRTVGPQKGERVFFRGNRDTEALFALYQEVGSGPLPPPSPAEANSGCSESCEMFPMG